jgi:putative ABC transport system permease protein
MNGIRAFLVRLGGLLRRDRDEQEMNAEIESHLQLHIDDNVRAGMTPAEARRDAVLKLGGIESVKEAMRDRQRLPWFELSAQDVRFAFRSLRKSKAFGFTVVTTLALCVWANIAVFSVLYGLVLKPLPFPESGQIVTIYNARPKVGQIDQLSGVAQYLDYSAHADLFVDFALWNGWMFNLSDDTGTSRYVGMRVTAEYFSVFGLQPLLGRFFMSEECTPGHDKVAVLTQSFWETQFHADPAIVGREVRLSGVPHTIVGVMPRHFEELSVAPLLLKPYAWSPQQEDPQTRLLPMGNLCARIKPGVPHGTALAQLQTLEERNRDNVADPALRDFLYSGGHRITLAQMRAQQTEPIKNAVLLLQGGAMFVLMLGAVNIASLMLARANTRAGEFALRQALGASRWTLSRHLLTEAAALALAGGALGLMLGWASIRLINTYMADVIYGIPPVRFEAGLIGLTLAVSVVVTFLIGLLPIFRLCRTGNLQSTIQRISRSASASSGIRAMSGTLVIAQVALALILLIGAGLLLRSFAKVMAIDPGFAAAHVIHARIAYDASYTDVTKLQGLQQRLLEEMRSIPGVDAVAYSDRLPGFADNMPATLPIRGREAGHEGTHPTAALFRISPDYLQTMGIRLLEGRDFNADDLRPEARKVFIVDRKFAERYFPGRSPVGEEFAFGPPGHKPGEAPVIVGVAEIARVNGLENKNGSPYVYTTIDTSRGGLSVELRTTRAFVDIFPLIRAAVRKVDPTLPIYQAQSMQTQLDKAAANRRGVMLLLGAFAAMALLLSAVGIYGMLAYDVTQRTREIGIRGAIGATRGQILAMILQQGLWKSGVGLAIGLVGAYFLTRTIRGLLFEVQHDDPVIFCSVVALLLLVTLLASWLPARRAAKVDPIVALRCE